MRLSKKDIIALAVFAALIIIFCVLVMSITNKGNDREIDLVRTAVKNAALTCYSVEGVYPDDIEYLRENYGLAYNDERYVVFYDAFASNLMPSISVVEKGDDTP